MINDALDLNRWRQQLVQRTRVQIPDFLQPEAAEAIHRCLREDTPWALAERSTGTSRTVDAAAYAAMPEAERRALLEKAYAAARDGFQYSYDSYMIVRAVKEGRIDGLAEPTIERPLPAIVQVDARRGTVHAERGAEGSLTGSTASLANLAVPPMGGMGQASGNGSASTNGSANAQLIGTDAVTGTLAPTAGSAKGLAAHAAGTAAGRLVGHGLAAAPRLRQPGAGPPRAGPAPAADHPLAGV